MRIIFSFRQASQLLRAEKLILRRAVNCGNECVSSKSFDAVMQTVKAVVVEQNRGLLDSHARQLVQEERVEGETIEFDAKEKEISADVRNMYTLLAGISNGCEVLLNEFTRYGKKLGEQAVVAVIARRLPPDQVDSLICNSLKIVSIVFQTAEEFIKAMLVLRERLTRLVADFFGDDQEFTRAMAKIMSAAVNYRPDEPGTGAMTPPRAADWVRDCSQE